MTDPNTALVLAIGGLVAALIDYAVERSPSPHNSIVGAMIAAWKAWRARGAALLLAGLLGGCQLGPKGRAAVAGQIAIKTVDAACDLHLDDMRAHFKAYTITAIAECKDVVPLSPCALAKLAPRERAATACEAYGFARLAASHGLQRDLTALADDAKAALSLVGLEVK